MPRVKREREEELPREESDAGEEPNHETEDGFVDTDAAYENDGAGPSGSRKARRVAFFAKGTIKQVKVHDFMTYNGTVTIRPGPRLNLVIGPNGTGKSSFVCALCIGLNGSPKTLGRSDDLKDFVRRGTRACWTEITLSSGGEGRDHVVRRHITLRSEREADGTLKDRHESKWAVNGREVPAREVDKLVRSLNIQFDNLCQFLPQDKVVEFARMNQVEVLEATEKAVGDASLYEQHQKLKQLRKDEKQVAADHNTTSSRLAKLQADHERQRRDYERFQHREKLLKEARSFRSQAKWLEVFAKAKAAKVAQERLKEKREELRALEDQQEEDVRPIRQREDLIAQLKLRRATLERQARDLDVKMRRLGTELQKHDEDILALADEMSNLDEQSKQRAAAITAARQKLVAAEAELAQAPDMAPQALVDRFNELRTLAQAGRHEAMELENALNNLAMQDHNLQGEMGRVRADLDQLNSRKYQLLQSLSNINGYHNLAQLHHWLEQHRADGTFKGPVLGPVVLEMTVNAPPGLPHAMALQYVESICWGNLGTYMVSCKEDEGRLVAEVRRLNVGVKVKIVAAEEDMSVPYDRGDPAVRVGPYSRFGVMHTLDELIDAPPTIMRYLARSHKIDTIMIGNNDAVSCLPDISRETRILTLLLGNSRFNILRSRYSAAKSIEETELYGSRLLASAGGSEGDAERAALTERARALMQEREALRASMDEKRGELQRKQQEVSDWNAEMTRIKDQVDSIRNRRVALANNVHTAKRQLANKEAVPDPELRRPQLRRAIEEQLVAHAQMCQRLVGDSEAAWASVKATQVLEFRLREAGAQLTALKECRKNRETALAAARNAVVDADNAFKAHKNEVNRAKEVAEQNYPLDDSDKAEVKRHEEAGTPAATLVTQAEEKEAEAERVVCNNQNVVAEFQRRQGEINTLTQTQQQHETELQRLRQEITDVKNLWLPEIQRMVETINESFSINFKEIGYAGQVRLHEDEDFDKYAIEILVQFRAAEEMQLLTANRQSGGERSVSTLLYLIALQGVTDTPFRVVDEINQGMDPINERKVFQHLVVASCEDHTPQCFMLTPKLLDGLHYTRDCHILNLMAGLHIGQLVEGFQMGRGHNNGPAMFGVRSTPILEVA